MSVTRRGFLTRIGIGAVALSVGAWIAAFERLMQPNITTSAPGPVEVGTAGDYTPGTLTYVERARAYIGRDAGGIYAILAVCTHLGCTPRLGSESFVCPCHGSRFSREGQVLNGPTVRALDCVFVGRAANNNLVVDRSRVVDAAFRLAV